MTLDRERLALALVNSDREMAGLPTVESRETISNSDGYCINADAILAEIEAQGFAVVPREPSENTQLHGRDAISDRLNRKDDDMTITAEDAAACWRAMIDAASAGKEKG